MSPDLMVVLLMFLLLAVSVFLVRRYLREKGAISFLWLAFWGCGICAFVFGWRGDSILAALLLIAALVALIGACALEYLKRAEK